MTDFRVQNLEVNTFFQRPALGLQKSARHQKLKENQVPIQGKTKHSGNLVFSGPVPQPGTKGLMTQAHILVWNLSNRLHAQSSFTLPLNFLTMVEHELQFHNFHFFPPQASDKHASPSPLCSLEKADQCGNTRSSLERRSAD